VFGLTIRDRDLTVFQYAAPPIGCDVEAIGGGRDLTAFPIYRAGIGRRVPPGFVRIGPITTLPRVLHNLGFCLEAVLAPSGISADILSHPDNAVPYPTLSRILSDSVAVTGRDDIGLLVGAEAHASQLGLVGFLLQQAGDVRGSLGDLARYLHYSDRGAVVRVWEADGLAALGYAIYEADAEDTAQIYDGAIAIACNILRDLCGPQWTPVEVMLARREPAHPVEYERVFGAPIRFDAEQSAVLFSAHWLDAPVRHSDPELRRLLQEQIDLLEAEESGSVTEQVRRLVRVLLLTSVGSLGSLSELLNMTPRTLARRLAAEGTSFKQISDEVHYSVARQYLANTALSITEVSLAMKYSEASAFTRAFRGWAGQSPSAWRALNRSAGTTGEKRPMTGPPTRLGTHRSAFP